MGIFSVPYFKTSCILYFAVSDVDKNIKIYDKFSKASTYCNIGLLVLDKGMTLKVSKETLALVNYTFNTCIQPQLQNQDTINSH